MSQGIEYLVTLEVRFVPDHATALRRASTMTRWVWTQTTAIVLADTMLSSVQSHATAKELVLAAYTRASSVITRATPRMLAWPPLQIFARTSATAIMLVGNTMKAQLVRTLVIQNGLPIPLLPGVVSKN